MIPPDQYRYHSLVDAAYQAQYRGFPDWFYSVAVFVVFVVWPAACVVALVAPRAS